jgi:hypothetical protein
MGNQSHSASKSCRRLGQRTASVRLSGGHFAHSFGRETASSAGLCGESAQLPFSQTSKTARLGYPTSFLSKSVSWNFAPPNRPFDAMIATPAFSGR